MRAALAIAGTELRRFTRDRSNIFFVLIFPMLLVFVLGLQFGGGGDQDGRVVIAGADGQLRQAITAELEPTGTEVVAVEGAEQMRTEVARERAEVGLVIDASAEQAFATGEPGEVEMITSTGANAPMVQQRVITALRALTGPQAELTGLTQLGVNEQEASAALDRARSGAPPVQLSVVDAGGETTNAFAGLGRFDLEAGSMLLLFVFLSTLSSGVTLIQSRRLGVQARVVAAPVSAPAAIGGQVLARWLIAFFQGGYIMVASMVLFDVNFGNLPAALVLLAAFGAVATGAAMLVGALIDHEGAATGVSVGLGLVLAALGGLMFPLDLFPDTLRTVAQATPHAWGYEAFAELQRHGGGLADILPELGVLAAMAAVLVVAGAVALRRAVARSM